MMTKRAHTDPRRRWSWRSVARSTGSTGRSTRRWPTSRRPQTRRCRPTATPLTWLLRPLQGGPHVRPRSAHRKILPAFHLTLRRRRRWARTTRWLRNLSWTRSRYCRRFQCKQKCCTLFKKLLNFKRCRYISLFLNVAVPWFCWTLSSIFVL